MPDTITETKMVMLGAMFLWTGFSIKLSEKKRDSI